VILLVYGTILVLDNVEQKILSLVPILRAPPVGVPSKVMMTMTTSTADPISPQRSPTHSTTESSSFIQKELTATNSSRRCCDDECSDPSTILRELPTRKFSAPNATAVVDPLDDDDETSILIAKAQESTTWDPTFLQEWEAFYKDFKTSTTYALATSSAAQLAPSLVDDDDADDDCKIYECDIEHLPPNSSAGLRRLRHCVRELEKVNIKFASFVELSYTTAPCQPTLRTIVNNLPHPQPGVEPKCDAPPQDIPTMATPPAPNLLSGTQNPTQQPGQEPQRDGEPQDVPMTAPPPAPDPSPSYIQHQTQQSSPTDRRHSTIPNWARPAVTTPAAKLAGMFCTGKPPPRPERKTVPFRKKPQTKPHAANQKDFLRPP